MRGWAATLRTELAQGSARWIVALTTLAVVALLWLNHTDDWGGRWNSLGSYLRELTIVIGPICVVLGCWTAGRAHRAGVGELMASTARSTLARHSATIVALWLSISGGTLLAWGTAAASILAVGGWGSSAAALYLAGVLPTVLGYATAGFVVGVVAPWRVAAPMAGAATYVVLGLATWGSDGTAVALGSGWLGGEDGYLFDTDALWLSSGVLLAVAVALWALSSVERRPAGGRSWIPAAGVGVLATSVLYPWAVQAADSGTTGMRLDPDPPLACTRAAPRTCVYAEDRLLLAQVAERAVPVLDRLERVVGAPTTVAPRSSPEDPTAVLWVEPGATSPTGEQDPRWGGPIHLGVEQLFWPSTYCPQGRFDLAPQSVERAFGLPVELTAAWVDQRGAGRTPEHWSGEQSTAAERELVARFLASSETERAAYASRLLAASQECDLDALAAATLELTSAP